MKKETMTTYWQETHKITYKGDECSDCGGVYVMSANEETCEKTNICHFFQQKISNNKRCRMCIERIGIRAY